MGQLLIAQCPLATGRIVPWVPHGREGHCLLQGFLESSPMPELLCEKTNEVPQVKWFGLQAVISQ